MLQPGQVVRVNLAGLQAEGVMFQAAVTDAVGHIVKQTSEQPPKYLVKLLFSFRGVSESRWKPCKIAPQAIAKPPVRRLSFQRSAKRWVRPILVRRRKDYREGNRRGAPVLNRGTPQLSRRSSSTGRFNF